MASFEQRTALETSLRTTVRQAWLETQQANPDLSLLCTLVERLNELTHPDYRAENGPMGLDLSYRAQTVFNILAEHAGNYFSAETLAALINVRTSSCDVIKVYICKIRAELSRLSLEGIIETKRGRGYRIDPLHAASVRRLRHV